MNDEAFKSVDNVLHMYAETISKKGLLQKPMENIAKLKLSLASTLQTNEALGRPTFNFKNAASAEEFFEKLKYVAKESPETAKFLL